MFNTTKKLEEQLVEQSKLISELTSEIRALQTQLRFILDDTDAIRQEIRSVRRGVYDAMEEQQSTGNWKVERL
jgi:chromosome segregation ATPase